MRKVLLILALIMPMIIVCSCSDDKENEYDNEVIKKEYLIGTWLIEAPISKYTRIKIIFQENDQFSLITFNEKISDNGDIIYSESKFESFYAIEDNIVSFGNEQELRVKSLKKNTLEGELNLGFGLFHVVATKQ